MDREPQVYLLPSNLGHLEFVDEGGRRASGPVALARALASSPAWHDMHDIILVVRQAPRPLMGMLGYFTPEAQSRLAALSWQIEHVVPRLRYVNYRQAEKAASRVAQQLIARFGQDTVSRFRFMALPRGGYFVMGMLAYALNVERERLNFPHPVNDTLVVVDDCALTGIRLRQFLRDCPSREIIFAHLWSHPDLRSTIQKMEPRVLDCVSAQDLHDHAPDQLGEDYAGWRERWLTRSPEAYWVGLTEHVCFPWSEPDVGIWNPVTGQEEPGWRLVPPELCLKNRSAPGIGPDRLQIQPLGPGPLRPAEHVLYGELDDEVLIANVDSRETFALSGVAADMWKGITTLGRPGEVLASIAHRYDVDPSQLRGDLMKFVEDLVEKRLVQVTEVVGVRD